MANLNCMSSLDEKRLRNASGVISSKGKNQLLIDSSPLTELLKRLLAPKQHPSQNEHHPEQVGHHGHDLKRQIPRHYRAILL